MILYHFALFNTIFGPIAQGNEYHCSIVQLTIIYTNYTEIKFNTLWQK